MVMPDLSAAVGVGGGEDWADNDNDHLDYGGGIPPQEVKMNGDGTKTVIDYSMSEDGYLSSTTTVYKVDKVTRTVSRGVAARKKWAKFGECTGKPVGILESGVSTVSVDEINIEWMSQDDDKDEDEEEKDFAKMAERDIQSRLKMERFRQRIEERKLGVANWAQKMSMEAAAKNPGADSSVAAVSTGASAQQGLSSGSTGGKYVPPSKRNLGPGGPGGSSASGMDVGGGGSAYSRDDSATVRISNVSKNTSEADLEDLCQRFGPIRRIFLSRDRETGESKGFAFVAFQNKGDAERCISRLDGYGYDHLILSVEWSKPKEPRDGEVSRPPSFAR